MGYRSDVLLAVAFDSKEERDEVWAVYCMNPNVQQHNLAEAWETHDGDECFMLWYQATDVKWYESYEDVQGFEHMLELVEKFGEERDFNYAGCKLRIGENTDDAEAYDICSDDGTHLQHALWDMCGIERRIINNF
jgi:hypothetical protein